MNRGNVTRGWRPRAIALIGGVVLLLASAPAPTAGYPPDDAGYLDYGEMVAEILAIEASNPAIADVFSIGVSYEGRELWAAKVSDNVGVDEDEPEVVFDASMHGREHMSTEAAVALFRSLVGGYGSDPRTTSIVDHRETTIIFNLNPDGSEYDHASGAYQMWRKNRQPTPGSAEIGTDINRNFGYRWGTNPLNASPAVETYRGPSAWSTPEATAFRDYVDSRVVGGEQQIRVHVTIHQYGRVVLYPYGYTTESVPSDMTADDHAVLSTMAGAMASASGYHAAQSSAWAGVNVGNQMDWMYAAHDIFSFTIEMGDAFYMGDEAIGPEVTRVLPASYYAIEQADCPYEVIGRGAQHCPPHWVSRLAGNDRYETASAISRATFGPGAPVAFVATGINFPDALAAGVAGSLDDGPVLLARPTILPATTAEELARLQPDRIVVVGGPAAISQGVLDELRRYTTGTVTRLAGTDRYGTAAAISEATFGAAVPVAFIATGENFPDGLAGVPAAAQAQGPLLLVRHDSVPSAVADELTRLRPGRIEVLGGPAAISDATVAALSRFTSGSVTRLAGSDRYATAAEIAREHFTGADIAYLATGLSFPDALSGGPPAADSTAPVLLTTPWRLEEPTADLLGALAPNEIVVLGGTAAISRGVAAAAALAAR